MHLYDDEFSILKMVMIFRCQYTETGLWDGTLSMQCSSGPPLRTSHRQALLFNMLQCALCMFCNRRKSTPLSSMVMIVMMTDPPPLFNILSFFQQTCSQPTFLSSGLPSPTTTPRPTPPSTTTSTTTSTSTAPRWKYVSSAWMQVLASKD